MSDPFKVSEEGEKFCPHEALKLLNEFKPNTHRHGNAIVSLMLLANLDLNQNIKLLKFHRKKKHCHICQVIIRMIYL
jgi:hypothetical protein